MTPASAQDDSKLPFLQLWVADYLRDTRHLSLSTRGAWMDILCAMHVSQERGVVIFNRLKLARFLGAQVEQVDGVLEELRDPYNATGRPVCDFEDLGGGNFKLTCRRMVRDEQRRITNRQNGQRGGNPRLIGTRLSDTVNRTSNPPVKPAVNPRDRVRERTGEESPDPSSRPVAARAAADVGTPGAGELTYQPDQPEHDDAPAERNTRPRNGSASRSDDESTAASKPAARKKGERKLTDEQSAARDAFIEWWCAEAYPKRMQGVVYAFKAEPARNGKAVRQILEAVDYELDEAKAIAQVYLDSDDVFIAKRRRPLFGISEQLTTWVQQMRSARFYGGRNGQQHWNNGGESQPKRELPSLLGRPTRASDSIPGGSGTPALAGSGPGEEERARNIAKAVAHAAIAGPAC